MGERHAEVRIAVILSVAILIAVIQISETPSAVTQNATDDFPNEEVPVVAPVVVRDVARGVVIQSAAPRSAATQCVPVAVFQYVADPDAMVVLQNEAAKVLPDGAPAVVLSGRLGLDAVHVVPVLASSSLRVVRCAAQE